MRLDYYPILKTIGTEIITPRSRMSYKLKALGVTPCPFCSKQRLIEEGTYLGETVLDHNKVLFTHDKSNYISNWIVLVVKNKYPIVEPSEMKKQMGVESSHLVLIEARSHLEKWHYISPRKVTLILKSYVEIMKLYFEMGFVYVALFKNQGAKAGASVAHVHSQMIFLDRIPVRVEEMVKELNFHRQCGICGRVESLMQSENRKVVLYESKNFIMYCPRAPYPFTIRIIPKRHVPTLMHLNDDEINELGMLLLNALYRLASFLGNKLSYNILYYQAPVPYYDLWHLWIEITPRGINEPAGFELLTDIRVGVPPEIAANILKTVPTHLCRHCHNFVRPGKECPYCGYENP